MALNMGLRNAHLADSCALATIVEVVEVVEAPPYVTALQAVGAESRDLVFEHPLRLILFTYISGFSPAPSSSCTAT
mgnify:CR=1 FL=1